MSKVLENAINDEVTLESLEASAAGIMKSLAKYIEDSIAADEFDILYESFALSAIAHQRGMSSDVFISFLGGNPEWCNLYLGAALCALSSAFNTVIQKKAMERKGE